MAVAQTDRNPFIIAPGEYWADRETLWNKIANYIELARHTRSNEIIVLTGDYGCGTTHTLKYMKKYLTEKGATATYIVMPVEGTLEDLYSAFIKEIGEEKRTRIIAKMIDDLAVRELADKRFDVKDLEAVLGRLVSSGRLSRGMSLRDMDILREAGVLGKLPSLSELWTSIIFALSTKDWPVFILIDELDVAAAEPKSSIELQRLRQVYDDSLFGLCLVFGLKGEPKDARITLGKALYTRMSLQPIQLYPLSKEEAKVFLKAVLEKTRTSSSPFFPFTEEAIETLVDVVCPTTPRRLLRIGSLVFEQARMEKQETIDGEFVSKIVAKFGEISVQEARGLTIELADTSAKSISYLPESLAEFVKSKGSPTKHSVLVVLFGYWLFHKEKQKSFNVKDIEKCYDDARIPESSNTSQYLNEAQSEGYFKRLAEKKDNRTAWTITQTGEAFVDHDKWKTTG
jgi:hypothetical protein